MLYTDYIDREGDTLDKFGKSFDAEALDNSHFRARVHVCVSPTFFGWLFGFGGKIVIENPGTVRERYLSEVKKTIEYYE